MNRSITLIGIAIVVLLAALVIMLQRDGDDSSDATPVSINSDDLRIAGDRNSDRYRSAKRSIQKSDAKGYKVPSFRSDLNVDRVVALLNTKPTYREFVRKVSCVPLVRVGPGYELFPLSDGSVVIPLMLEDSNIVSVWSIADSSGKKVAEQGAASDR